MEEKVEQKHKLQSPQNINFGCDPEFFFATQDGEVVGAEKVIDKKGLKVSGSSFELDGVQVELHPAPNTCRANLSNEIQRAFIGLRDQLKDKKVTANFSTVINLEKKELDSLSAQAKVFGCAPSKSAYKYRRKIATVDAAKYTKRAAGGHLHLGLPKILMEDRERLVPIMDILVGNTCVMIDRDPMAAERRKLYGRAGEYRLPKHGIEYRVLSNFWLRSYQLMSLVMGLARLSSAVLQTTVQIPTPEQIEKAKKQDAQLKRRNEQYGLGYHERHYPEKLYPGGYYISQLPKSFDAEKELLSRVERKMIVRAINRNDYDLAQKNWESVAGFIKDFVPDQLGTDGVGLCASSLPAFEQFLKRVKEKGLEYWFPQEPVDHWCKKAEGHNTGWESWLGKVPTKELGK